MLARISEGRATGCLPADDIESLLEQLAGSETFRTAPAMRTLLLYLWHHKGEPISEYAIAVDALGRPPDFDPKADATVRVQIARLRAKLKEFYAEEGVSFPLRLSIPLGGHDLQWSYEAAPQTSTAAVPEALPARSPRVLVMLAAASLLLFIACISLILENRSLKRSLSLPPSRPPLPRLWQSFLAGGKPTVIVVPSPLHFAWPDHNVYLRDLTISEFSDWPDSRYVRELVQKLGPPTLLQPYVGALDMFAGVKLLQYLQAEGQQVQLLESRNFPSDSFGAQNTIFIGLPRNTLYLKQLLDRTNFYIARVDPALVKSRVARPGEPLEYEEVRYSAERRMVPGIVIFLPVRPEGTRSMMLIGGIPTTLSSLLISLEGLNLLGEQWTKAGSPDAWEAVVQAEMYRTTVLKARPVALRQIPASFWK